MQMVNLFLNIFLKYTKNILERYIKTTFIYEEYGINNLPKVRPLFTISHRGSDNSPLLIVFNDNYIDQSNCDFNSTTFMFEKIICLSNPRLI